METTANTTRLTELLVKEKQGGANGAFREVLRYARAVEAGAYGDEPGEVSAHMARVIAQSVRMMLQYAEQAEGLRSLLYMMEEQG